MTAYVVSGLGQAQAAGYTVDDDRLAQRARNGSSQRSPRILT